MSPRGQKAISLPSWSVSPQCAKRSQAVGGLPAVLRDQCGELCTTQRRTVMSKSGETLAIHINYFVVQSKSPGGRATSPRGAEINFRTFMTVFFTQRAKRSQAVGGLPTDLRDQCIVGYAPPNDPATCLNL